MQAAATFKVVVKGLASSVDEWRRAMDAPASELPPLSDAQKDMARRFGVKEEDYARSSLAGVYAQKRMRDRGEKLGVLAAGVLQGLGDRYTLLALVGEMFEERWILRIQERGERIVDVAFERDFVDDMLDSGVNQRVFKNRILEELGRGELAEKP